MPAGFKLALINENCACVVVATATSRATASRICLNGFMRVAFFTVKILALRA